MAQISMCLWFGVAFLVKFLLSTEADVFFSTLSFIRPSIKVFQINSQNFPIRVSEMVYFPSQSLGHFYHSSDNEQRL